MTVVNIMRCNLVLGIVFAFLMLLPCKAFAMDDYSAITQDSKIQQVLDLMKHHSDGTRETLNTLMGDNLSKRPVKVMFYDLSLLNSAYANYDALTCKHKSGTLYIFINSIHKNASIEAIACLLSHEALHQDDNSSYQEEIAAWTKEATTWSSFKTCEMHLDSSDALVKRLNAIEKMYVSSNYHSTEISREVHGNAGYSGLAEYSPGYGI
jgi:hypothetical protein